MKDVNISSSKCKNISLLLLELKNILNVADEDKLALTMFREYEQIDTFKAMIQYVKDDNIDIRKYRIEKIKKNMESEDIFMMSIINLVHEIFTEYENRKMLLEKMESCERGWRDISYEYLMKSRKSIQEKMTTRQIQGAKRRSEPYFNKKKYRKYIAEYRIDKWKRRISKRTWSQYVEDCKQNEEYLLSFGKEIPK